MNWLKKNNILTATAGGADPDAHSPDIPARAADSKNRLEKQQQNGNLTNELMSELSDTPRRSAREKRRSFHRPEQTCFACWGSPVPKRLYSPSSNTLIWAPARPPWSCHRCRKISHRKESAGGIEQLSNFPNRTMWQLSAGPMILLFWKAIITDTNKSGRILWCPLRKVCVMFGNNDLWFFYWFSWFVFCAWT